MILLQQPHFRGCHQIFSPSYFQKDKLQCQSYHSFYRNFFQIFPCYTLHFAKIAELIANYLPGLKGISNVQSYEIQLPPRTILGF